MLNGVYVGNNSDDLARYENWKGEQADLVSTYVGGRGWWEMNPDWFMGQHQDRPMLMNLPIFPQESNLWAVASGEENWRFREIAEKISANAENVAAPDGSLYIRTGWEVGGDWFEWSRQAEQDPGAFRDAFRQIAETFESVDSNFKMVWDVAWDQGDTSQYYPGDDVVDVVSVDIFWHPEWRGNDGAEAWKRTMESDTGPSWVAEFARDHGKQIAISEWGVPEGYDARAYIEAFSAFLNDPANDVAYNILWDSNADYAGLLSDWSGWSSGQAYKDAFA
jgi:hypothetical protein